MAHEFATDRDRLLAECVASQTKANFPHPDARVFRCLECGADGFNTGWGYTKHVCGAEIMPDPEVPEFSNPCGSIKEAGGSE